MASKKTPRAARIDLPIIDADAETATGKYRLTSETPVPMAGKADAVTYQ